MSAPSPSSGFNFYVVENTYDNYDVRQNFRFFKTKKEAKDYAIQHVEKGISDGGCHNTANVFGIDPEGHPKSICFFMAQLKRGEEIYTVFLHSSYDDQDGQAEQDKTKKKNKENQTAKPIKTTNTTKTTKKKYKYFLRKSLR